LIPVRKAKSLEIPCYFPTRKSYWNITKGS
jgi:hypothetical protein